MQFFGRSKFTCLALGVFAIMLTCGSLPAFTSPASAQSGQRSSDLDLYEINPYTGERTPRYTVARFRQTFRSWELRRDKCSTDNWIIISTGSSNGFSNAKRALSRMAQCVMDWRRGELARMQRALQPYGVTLSYRGSPEIRTRCKSNIDCELLGQKLQEIQDMQSRLVGNLQKQQDRIGRRFNRNIALKLLY